MLSEGVRGWASSVSWWQLVRWQFQKQSNLWGDVVWGWVHVTSPWAGQTNTMQGFVESWPKIFFLVGGKQCLNSHCKRVLARPDATRGQMLVKKIAGDRTAHHLNEHSSLSLAECLSNNWPHKAHKATDQRNFTHVHATWNWTPPLFCSTIPGLAGEQDSCQAPQVATEWQVVDRRGPFAISKAWKHCSV